MHRGQLVIRVSQRPSATTARYLICRIRALWPESYAETADGERWTRWSTKVPDAFTLCSADAEESADATEIEVEVTEDRVVLAWSDLGGLTAVQFLAKDAIWGPDWETVLRTQAPTEVTEALAG